MPTSPPPPPPLPPCERSTERSGEPQRGSSLSTHCHHREGNREAEAEGATSSRDVVRPRESTRSREIPCPRETNASIRDLTLPGRYDATSDEFREDTRVVIDVDSRESANRKERSVASREGGSSSSRPGPTRENFSLLLEAPARLQEMHRSVMERARDRVADRTADRTVNRSLDRTADQTVERTADRTVNRSLDRTAERTAERTADRTVNRSLDCTADRTAERPADRTVNRSLDCTADRTAERTADRTVNRMNDCLDVLSSARSSSREVFRSNLRRWNDEIQASLSDTAEENPKTKRDAPRQHSNADVIARDEISNESANERDTSASETIDREGAIPTQPMQRESKGKGKGVKGTSKKNAVTVSDRPTRQSSSSRDGFDLEAEEEADARQEGSTRSNNGTESSTDVNGGPSSSRRAKSPNGNKVVTTQSMSRSSSIAATASNASPILGSSSTLDTSAIDINVVVEDVEEEDPGEIYPDLAIDDTSSDDDVEVVAIAGTSGASLKVEAKTSKDSSSVPSSSGATSERDQGFTAARTRPVVRDVTFIKEKRKSTAEAKKSAIVVDLTHESDDEDVKVCKRRRVSFVGGRVDAPTTTAAVAATAVTTAASTSTATPLFTVDLNSSAESLEDFEASTSSAEAVAVSTAPDSNIAAITTLNTSASAPKPALKSKTRSVAKMSTSRATVASGQSPDDDSNDEDEDDNVISGNLIPRFHDSTSESEEDLSIDGDATTAETPVNSVVSTANASSTLVPTTTSTTTTPLANFEDDDNAVTSATTSSSRSSRHEGQHRRPRLDGTHQTEAEIFENWERHIAALRAIQRLLPQHEVRMRRSDYHPSSRPARQQVKYKE